MVLDGVRLKIKQATAIAPSNIHGIINLFISALPLKNLLNFQATSAL
jgi:hypothetical protein